MRCPRLVALTTALALLPLLPKEARAASEPTTDHLLWGGVASLGLGTLFVGLGIYESATIKSAGGDFLNDPTFTDYRAHFATSEPDVCARAREGNPGTVGKVPDSEVAEVVRLCDSPSRESNSKRTLGYAFYGVGFLSLAVGATMLLMRPSETEKKAASMPTLRITPVLSPQGGALVVLGRF